jgi:competence protein ComEC
VPLLWLSLAFLTGIGLGAWARQPVWVWGGLIATGIGLALLERARRADPFSWQAGIRRFSPLPLGVLLVALFSGAMRWQAGQPAWTPADLAYHNDTLKMELTGWVASYPDRREQAVLLRVQVESLRISGAEPLPVRGKALVRLPSGGDWRYGDRIRLWGQPLTPPEAEDFSYRQYLARQGVHTYMLYPAATKTGEGVGSRFMALVYDLRENAYRTLNRIFPQPEASLLAGILLGLERDLPAELDRAFKDTGTAHIIAISGFNMAVLSGLFVALFGRILPRAWAALCAVLAISFYTLLVGANPAVVRAAVMGGMAIFGRLIGRSNTGLTPLGFSAAVMCLFNPLLPWDASFQLSFTATLGLVLYAEPLQRRFEAWLAGRIPAERARKLSAPVSEYVLFTLAAQLTTLPVTLVNFGRLSLTALVANPFILPAQPLVMQISGLAVLAGMLFLPLGQALAWLAWPLSAYTIRVVELFARIPAGVFSTGPLGVEFAIACYALLLGLTFGWSTLSGLRSRLKPAVLLAGLSLMTVLAWDATLHRPDGRLHLALLDLPESSAVLLHTPHGKRILIGGGQHANALAGAIGRETGIFNRLDGLVIYSASSDRLEGLPATLERVRVNQVYWAVSPPDKRAANRIQETLERQAIQPLLLQTGQELRLDEGVHLRVLAANQDGAALLLEYGGLRVLWPGGHSPAKLREMEFPLNGSVWVLDETDLKETTVTQWESLQPLAVLVAGRAEGRANWLSTSQYGRVELVSDGEQMWVRVERR